MFVPNGSNEILLLIYYTLQKVIQQVLATGPLVSHIDFQASPGQYMRDKDVFCHHFLMVNVSGESKYTVKSIHDLFKLMLHVLHLFNFIVLFLIILVLVSRAVSDRSEWKT